MMRDMRAHDIDMLTIGQYLAPSGHHLPVRRYVHPDTFRMFEREAAAMGFSHAAVGAMVRSSYHADQQAHAAGVAAPEPRDERGAGAPPSRCSPAATAASRCSALALAGHYGQRVELDLCRQLRPGLVRRHRDRAAGGPAMLELIGAMAAAHDLPHELLRADAALPALRRRAEASCTTSRAGAARCSCSACAATARTSRSPQFLEEKGLLRPMSRVDRAKLLRDRGRIDCVNCGGAIGKRRRALPVLPLGAEPARRRPPGARARSADTIEPPRDARARRRSRRRCNARPAARRCRRARR